MLSPNEMKDLLKHEEPVTDKHLVFSSKAWSTFRKNSPELWSQLLNEDISALPFLESAVNRMLEEYPNCSNDLSRIAQQALEIISKGEKLADQAFAVNQELEELIFLGDSSFWAILQEFLDSSPALLKLPEGKNLTLPTAKDQELTITPAGLEVLSGKRNWLEITCMDRWIRGIYLDA